MSDERYQMPGIPPGPPLQDLLDGPDSRMSFRSADRRERTDPYGIAHPARPNWLDATPPPAVRAVAPSPTTAAPVEPAPWEADPGPSVIASVLTGLSLGTILTVGAILWIVYVLDVDDEGLLPIPAETASNDVTR